MKYKLFLIQYSLSENDLQGLTFKYDLYRKINSFVNAHTYKIMIYFNTDRI